MLERSQIEKLLRLNGVAISAPEDEIKSVLISARWHETDVETAMLVLRENKKNHETHVDSMHKIFQSDSSLDSGTISSLLGIDVDLFKDSIDNKNHHSFLNQKFGQFFQIVMVSVCISALFLFASMWYLHIGIFHIDLQ
jgi:hypothetical protein